MRTSILGCLDYNDYDKVKENTRSICKVTHHDTRCVASCIAVTVAIATLLQRAASGTNNNNNDNNSNNNSSSNSSNSDVQGVIDVALQHALGYIDSKYRDEFTRHVVRDAEQSTLESLKLDEGKSIGYTLKCMASGFWGLCSSTQRSFKETLNCVAREAGDADT